MNFRCEDRIKPLLDGLPMFEEESEMNQHPLSHMIRIQRVNRIRVAWLLAIGTEVEKLERVARAAMALWPNVYIVPEWESTREELWEALKEVKHLL